MNSINKNQPEKNHEDLKNKDSIDKIIELASDQTCFLCTTQGAKGNARPMAVQKVDKQGNIWFLSASDSNQNKEIQENSSVNLYFKGNQHSDFMHLYGEATVLRDETIIKELWNPVLKTWFTEGENDPRITIIKFTTKEGYYWDTKHGNFIAGIKMLIGAATGQTLDDSIEGSLQNQPVHNTHISHG
ncbi:pyridoxamine 5'-phosphate oxidase family protein [Cytophaga hutchinsonii]|uniref:General stress protein n=1 Tax=Cytophaga hutchinsonii (strain ATCC 33406 / DSM 1761 / CIP 103989 / NBRC 15051 / NCIMB 9469 / D465) TaxID=269798 RepID=A0A6N4ST47_CYTH3|nr:pyridoxamine 5'-phosphate oxidase family protein [Cytophaga hutchinsonii]ABG59557.1 general stress protein [Cytophaga hutchinsonii ATCC 33406]SFX95455.1 General stress protein 26 [Cytophaga hutchinsonii ATCC 33406]